MTSPKYMLQPFMSKHLQTNTLQLWLTWSYFALFWNNVLIKMMMIWWWWL